MGLVQRTQDVGHTVLSECLFKASPANHDSLLWAWLVYCSTVEVKVWPKRKVYVRKARDGADAGTMGTRHDSFCFVIHGTSTVTEMV